MNINNEDKILELILPEYYNFKKQPEFFIESNKQNSIINREYFQNVSLLGERGSGKTSILNNLMIYLKSHENNKKYIVFDLITPEIINEEEDLLGWIISLVTDKAENILKEIKLNEEFVNNYKHQAYEKYNYREIPSKYQDLNRKIKELKESYFLRRSTYNEIIANDTLSTMEYIEKKSKKLKADTNLKSSFFNLINEIVDNGNEKMLIFLFDDVDIYSSKVCEVLKIIMNYLSHKNVITYIAGDYNSFIENITIELIKKENLLDGNLLECEFVSQGKNVKKIREYRAYEFLKKVLPPKYRYYIKNINNKTKYEIIKNYNKDLNEIKDERIKKVINHITYKGNIIYDYFDFLDDRIRGLNNILDFISKEYSILLKNLNNNEKDIKLKYDFLSKILDCIIHTNIELEKYENLIKKVINIPNVNDGYIEFTGYINYRFLINEISHLDENIFFESEFNNFSKEEFYRIYKIFVLSNFFEIMMEVLMNRGSSIHGKEELLEIINKISENNQSVKLLPNLDSVKEIIYLKERIFENLRYEEIVSLFSKENASNYLRYIYLKAFSNYKKENNHIGKKLENKKKKEAEFIVNIVFKELIDKDFSWCDKQIKWIYENVFNCKKSIEELKNNIELEFKDINEFLKINNFENEIDNMKLEKEKLIKERENFNLDDILNLFDLIIPLEKNKEKLTELEDLLCEKKSEKKEKEKQIKEIYSSLSNKLQKSKNYRKKCLTTINILKESIKSFLYDKKNKELWKNAEKYMQIIEGIIDKENLDSELLSSYTFEEVNLSRLIDEYNLGELNIINRVCTIAISNKNIIFAASEDNKSTLIKYQQYSMLLESLDKCQLIEVDELEEEVEILNEKIDELFRQTKITKEIYLKIKKKFEDKSIKYLYDDDNKKFNSDVPLILINQISDESLKYKKLYLNLNLKRVYNEIENEIFVNILNLKRKLKIFYESNTEILKSHFFANNLLDTYINELKIYDYGIKEIKALKNILNDLKSILNRNDKKTEQYIKFLNEVDNIIHHIDYILINENNSVFDLRKNFIINLLRYIVLEITRIEIERQEDNFNNKSTYTSLEVLKECLDDMKNNGQGCTLKVYLENMGNNEMESIFKNVK